MFFWDGGMKLAKADLAIDFSRRQPRAFISHAHTDHMARHEYALCTPATAALYRIRFGPHPTLEMPYRVPVEWGGLRLTTLPAGHCLGSAMLLVEDGDRRLLYTGDFKLRESATAEPAELVPADVLVMESTFGHPDFRLPPRAQAVEQLCRIVRQALADGVNPIVEAYPLGKAQEVTRLLVDAGFPVFQHPTIAAISRVYEACGASLGAYRVLRNRPEPQSVAIVPAGSPRWTHFDPQTRIAVTGWAADPRARYRLRVDHAVPLSDHADYDELFDAVARVRPRTVYCTHGPEAFVERLRDAGYDAYPLGPYVQRRLF